MGDSLPWELKLTLRRGCIYHYQDRTLSSGEPHYFIVINADPLGQQTLLLTIASSQVEKVKKRRTNLPPETLIEILPSDCEAFTKKSIVDCNKVFTKSLAELSDLHQKRALKEKGNLPAKLLEKLITALH